MLQNETAFREEAVLEAAAIAAGRPDVTIFPLVGDIGAMEFAAAERAFAAGRAAVARVSGELLRL